MKWGPEGKALLLEWDQNRFQATNISADEVEVIKDGAKANKKLAAFKTSKRSFCTVIFNMATVEKVKKKGGKKRVETVVGRATRIVHLAAVGGTYLWPQSESKAKEKKAMKKAMKAMRKAPMTMKAMKIQ